VIFATLNNSEMITHDLELTKIFLDNEYIIGLPTETVYGLAGNIHSEKAIKSIFELKKRPLFNPLIVHVKNKSAISTVAQNIPDKAYQLAEAFWPGPMTLILPKKSGVNELITAGKPTVAVRVPNHEKALQLLDILEYPLAAPSANPFGSISPTSAEHVHQYFGKSLPLILEGGQCTKGIESTIIGFEKDQPIVYRLGTLSLDEIESFLGVKLKQSTHSAESPEAPGMLSRHYSPRTPLMLTDSLEETIIKWSHKKIGVLTFGSQTFTPYCHSHLILSENENLEEAASRLYAALHQLDGLDLDLIIAEKFPEHGLGPTINDRLMRASK
jgi:L-threonylcarbamoyladenylate synthase